MTGAFPWLLVSVRQRHELSAVKIAVEQIAGLEIEETAEQRQTTGFNPLTNPGKRHQIAQRNADACQLTNPLSFILRTESRHLARFGGDVHPGPNEVAIDAAGQQGPYTAALRMPEDNNLLDAKAAHAEFQRCTGAVMNGIRLIGRNQIGDVADNKKITRGRGENHLRIEPAVTATDNHRSGCLADLSQMLQQLPMIEKAAGPKSLEAFD
jgi:hypothetical protein